MSKSWLFLKKFQTSLLFSSESTLLLLAAWVVLQSKQSMFQRNFFKKSQFIVISDDKSKFSNHHFSQKVRETDHLPSVNFWSTPLSSTPWLCLYSHTKLSTLALMPTLSSTSASSSHPTCFPRPLCCPGLSHRPLNFFSWLA